MVIATWLGLWDARERMVSVFADSDAGTGWSIEVRAAGLRECVVVHVIADSPEQYERGLFAVMESALPSWRYAGEDTTDRPDDTGAFKRSWFWYSRLPH